MQHSFKASVQWFLSVLQLNLRKIDITGRPVIVFYWEIEHNETLRGVKIQKLALAVFYERDKVQGRIR